MSGSVLVIGTAVYQRGVKPLGFVFSFLDFYKLVVQNSGSCADLSIPVSVRKANRHKELISLKSFVL